MKKQTIWVAEISLDQVGFRDVIIWRNAFKDKATALASAKSFRRKYGWVKSTWITVYDMVIN